MEKNLIGRGTLKKKGRADAVLVKGKTQKERDKEI